MKQLAVENITVYIQPEPFFEPVQKIGFEIVFLSSGAVC